MFVKVLSKTFNGSKHYYAYVVENHREGKKTIQTVVRNLGPVTEDQIPYLKAAWAKNKPRLVYDELSELEK